MLCQIEMCLRYCKRHNRSLILDTTHSGLRDDFLKYFSFRNGCGVEVTSWLEAQKQIDLNSFSTYPKGVQGTLGLYTATEQSGFSYLHPDSGQILTFDFGKKYDESILIHEACGGGFNSYWLLQYLEPTDWLVSKLKPSLSDLPDSFVAVHIRNTDLATNYREFLHSIDGALAGQNFFLCTDSGVVQNELKNAPQYKGRIFIIKALDPNSEQRLHDEDTVDESSNISLFSDLCAMALARNVYFTYTLQGRVSGFSGLAYAASASLFSKNLATKIGHKRMPRRSNGLRLNNAVMRYFYNQASLIAVKRAVKTILWIRERVLRPFN